MAFNKQDYVSGDNKTPVQRILDYSTINAIRSSRSDVTSSGVDLAKKLLLSGTSVDNITARVSMQTDALTSYSDDSYFAMAGLELSRTNGKSLSEIRRGGSEDIQQYLRSVNPSTKIAQKRRVNNIEILSAV